MGTITIKLYEEENEILVQFPCKKEVCPTCEGEGFVLRGGLRGAVFSAEEFYEVFEDEEDRAEYFRPGGRYDEPCDTCQGRNVVSVVDEEACARDPELTRWLGMYRRQQEEEAQFRREEEAERRMGC